MDALVTDKVGLVTGGSRGIGLATAVELIDSGARGVVITSRKPDNLASALEEIATATGRPDAVHGVVAPADDGDAALAAVAATVERYGALDILVNNAGTNPAVGNLMDVDDRAIDKTWAVNQKAPLIWTREAWAQWMGEHGGTVVNVASIGGLAPGPLLGAYNISKAALIHTTRQMAHEMAPRVRVNAVAPAVIKTRLSELLWSSDEESIARRHPLHRLGIPEDVANAIVFLCSDKATWITGVTLPVDGGVIGASGAIG